jgi:hypothetical protein
LLTAYQSLESLLLLLEGRRFEDMILAEVCFKLCCFVAAAN